MLTQGRTAGRRIPLPWPDLAIVSIVVIGLLLVYRVTTGASPMWDGVYYCFDIASGDPGEFLRGQHLLYGLAGYLAHRSLSLFAPLLPVWDALLLLSALSGALCVGTFYLGCRQLDVGRPAALSSALILAASVEFWRHAANVEYIVPNAMVLSLFFVAIGRFAAGHRRTAALAAGGALGLAILAHLRHVLLTPALLVVVLSSTRRWRRAAWVVTGLALVTGSGYLLGGWVRLGTLRPDLVLRWAVSNMLVTGGGAPPWWVWRLKNLLWTPIWQLGAIVDVAHVKHVVWASDRLRGTTPLLTMVVLATVCVGATAALARLGRMSARVRRATVALVLWVLCYAVVFSFWCPSEEAWWVSGLIPFLGLVALGIDGGSRWWSRALAITIGAVAVVSVSVLSLSGSNGILAAHRHMEPQLAHLFALHRDARPGDLVLWLGYLTPRVFGPSCRDVRPGVWDNPQGREQAKYFTAARCLSTFEVLNDGQGVLRQILFTLQTGRTAWASLSGCSVARTVTRTEDLDPASAQAIARLLQPFALVPTGTECLWTLKLKQRVELPSGDKR